MPKEKTERLRCLLARTGALPLDEAQLLELLLDYSGSRRDPETLARALLERFHSLEGVLTAPEETLLGVEGLSESALVLLRLAACLEQRACSEETARLRDVEAWIAYLEPLFLRQRRERVYLLCLDREGRLLECALLGEGNDGEVRLDIQTVCERCLRSGAEAVVLAHSHPSGIALPSQADIRTTRLCQDALREMGVQLWDHLVFADEDCVSLAQSGLL